ncbi:MAG: sulfatase, partial [Candidatus Hydrogenedentes bacterium]|nr:sulfatase [Candidatus Hydrogenedentota bacterium]
LIEFFEDHHEELYNLTTDPGEQENLIEKMPEKATKLREILHAWQQEVNARFPTSNPNSAL